MADGAYNSKDDLSAPVETTDEWNDLEPTYNNETDSYNTLTRDPTNTSATGKWNNL